MDPYAKLLKITDDGRSVNKVTFINAETGTSNVKPKRRCSLNRGSTELRSIIALAHSICLMVCLASLILATCASGSEESIGNRESKAIHESATGEPRQYFKINVGANQAKKRAFKGNASNRQDSTATSPKQRISNATLKRILNQSLALATNGSSPISGGNYYKSDKGSNFKFVFIQKATASPKKQASGEPSSSTKSLASPGTNSTAAQSLAASVSKQLAKSLLSSASNLVGNLSSVPSLSSIASQMVAQTVDLADLNSIASGSRRKQSGKELSSADSDSSVRGKPTKSKPSKIYNLPVKFVANGQPNHVVFSTIKKHFATIKKLQDERQKSYSSSDFSQDKQRRKHKLKGNSRLIYLPIKYLSNAKPNRILATKSIKSTHKSTSS